MAIIFLIVAILGFVDATWLTVEHYTQAIIPCSLTNGCELVTNSIYSTIAGIPVALLGSIFYLTMIVGTLIYLESKNVKIFNFITKLTSIGFGFSLWFLFAQIFLIHAFCQWCLGSIATSTILFILGYFVYPKVKRTSV